MFLKKWNIKHKEQNLLIKEIKALQNDWTKVIIKRKIMTNKKRNDINDSDLNKIIELSSILIH